MTFSISTIELNHLVVFVQGLRSEVRFLSKPLKANLHATII